MSDTTLPMSLSAMKIPIECTRTPFSRAMFIAPPMVLNSATCEIGTYAPPAVLTVIDRKSTRLNSSHDQISYAVFCLKKKKKQKKNSTRLANPTTKTTPHLYKKTLRTYNRTQLITTHAAQSPHAARTTAGHLTHIIPV